MGYVLARKHWGRGYMTEVGKKIVELAFADPAIVRVGAWCDVDNGASARVMEKLRNRGSLIATELSTPS